MIKYIITWVLVKIIPTACPDAGKADKFGRVQSSYNTCAVFHAERKTEKQKRIFYNSDSAKAFYQELMEEGKKGSGMFSDGIDSVIFRSEIFYKAKIK